MRKKREEPAEKLLTLHSACETKLKEEGFLSALYVPDQAMDPKKALILVGGSDGMFSLTRLIAEQFVKRGMTVLALAYWGREGLPTALEKIPLEYAEKAARFLKARGYEKIGIWGISMGSEYAMLAASCLPELISCCVAVSPMHVCSQAIQKKNAWHKSMKLLPGSAFSFRGRDIPCAPLDFDKKQILKDSLHRKEICLHSCYARAMESAPKEAEIPTENMSGPLLLLSADPDSMWQSTAAAEKLRARMENKGKKAFMFHYEYASHLLVPYKLKSTRMFHVERKFPGQCWESDQDAFQKTLSFLRNNW